MNSAVPPAIHRRLIPLARALRLRHPAFALSLSLLIPGLCLCQTPLDPLRSVQLSDNTAPASLTEEYIWTAGDVTARRPDHNRFPWNRPYLRIQPHFFRARFQVAQLPHSGTLYLAGPRSAQVYLNGKLLGQFSTNVDQPINFRVFHADATHGLRLGENELAIEAIRGRGVVSASDSLATQQLAYGEVLAVKLSAGAFGEEHAPDLLISNGNWRSHTGVAGDAWRAPDFDDTAWPKVDSLGPVESNVDFLQWSADAGMYGWPGYRGVSPWLRTFSLPVARVTHVYDGPGGLENGAGSFENGAGGFENLAALTGGSPAANFAVTLPQPAPSDAEAPALLLDFGREIAGRIVFESASAQDAVVSIAYGESEIEALATGITPLQRGGNYLGTNLLSVPAHGVARGPKSGFRYVRVRFLRGASVLAFRAIRAEGIAYPVRFEGSFQSSDPQLNRIWETAAYTAHLCMQDDIWDAVKRDRGRWAGDLDVEARTILPAFGNTFLIEDTLRHLAEETRPGQPVNGIAAYTAQWIAALSALYEDSGDRSFVVSQHAALVQMLKTMDSDLDPTTGLLKSGMRGWGFVDWAPGLYGASPDTNIGTTLEFLRAYQAAPALLRAAGDETAGNQYEAQAAQLRQRARAAFFTSTNTVGPTWQLNALAVLVGLDPSREPEIWNSIFAHVKQDAPEDQVISPYFNSYLLEAMARTGHARQALDWMRAYWGGMLAEGATSFWESYDLRWPKTDFHLSLQADGTSGYFVSLAHGWSSGPLGWIDENILGVRPAAPGYASVELRPRLLGLQFARGSVATPHGPIAISLDAVKGVSIDLPSGVESARVVLPLKSGGDAAPVTLSHSGHYDLPWP